MTNYKTHFMIRGILAVLLLITAGAGWFFSAPRQEQRRAAKRVFPGFIAEKAAEVAIEQGEDSLLFRRDGETWALRRDSLDIPLRESAMEDFLADLEDLKGPRLVARRPADPALYGLPGGKEAGEEPVPGDSWGLRIRDEQGETLLSADFGRNAQNPGDFYMRRRGKTAVYQIDSSLERFLRQEAVTWMNLRLFPRDFAAEDIISLSLQGEMEVNNGQEALRLGGDFSLYRNGDQGWQWQEELLSPEDRQSPEDRRPPAEEKVASLLASWASARGRDIIDPVVLEGEEAQVTARMKTRDDREWLIQAGSLPGGEPRYFLTITGQSQAYEVSPWTLIDLFPPARDLFPEGEEES